MKHEPALRKVGRHPGSWDPQPPLRRVASIGSVFIDEPSYAEACATFVYPLLETSMFLDI
jgi:hypothetical protein